MKSTDVTKRKGTDFSATRTHLSEQLEEAGLQLEAVGGRLGELALDVELGSASVSELEAARVEEATLTARVSELGAALETLDGREAEHLAAQAERERQAAVKRVGELEQSCNKAGREVVEHADALVTALAAGGEASREAAALARQHGIGATGVIAGWPSNALSLVLERLDGRPSGPPEKRERAEAAVTTMSYLTTD